jgi:dihydroxyacetone kinase-like protein
VFTSPSADAMVNVAKVIHGGQGVLFLYGNYFGDTMNFDLAAEILADEEGIQIESVRISDDAASANRSNWQNRRGVAGIFFAYKISGASAEAGLTLQEVKDVAIKVNSNMATMGVALTSCTIPSAGKATFSIGEDEMEIGMGIHGEPGIRRTHILTAQEITEEILTRLVQDLSLANGDEVALLVNGAGATPLEELYIMTREAYIWLENHNIMIYKSYVGEFATSLEMAGCSLTLLKLDDELKRYLNAPAASPFFKQWQEG